MPISSPDHGSQHPIEITKMKAMLLIAHKEHEKNEEKLKELEAKEKDLAAKL